MIYLQVFAVVMGAIAMIFSILAVAYLGHISLRLREVENRTLALEETPAFVAEAETSDSIGGAIADSFMKEMRKHQKLMN